MTNREVVQPRKLIEVALPLDEINKAAGREKAIRHGHPSSLHLWWARRPLAAARAVIFAQLVNDPAWKYSLDDLKKPQIRSAVTRKRNELFRLISELVKWENTNDEGVLRRAKAAVRESWRETCEANKGLTDSKIAGYFDPERLPPFHDPFGGGGSIPLEAQRLGLAAHSSDLNPVAVLLNRALIELPPALTNHAPVGPIRRGDRQSKAAATENWAGTKGLATDVRRYGEWFCDEVRSRTARLYPTAKLERKALKERPDLVQYAGRELPVIAWIWARTVISPNPAARGARVPLTSGFELLTRANEYTWVEPIIHKDGTIEFEVRVGRAKDAALRQLAESGTRTGKAQDFMCLVTRTAIPRDYIRAEGKAGRLGTCLLAAVADGGRARVYLSPRMVVLPELTREDDDRIRAAKKSMLNGSTPTRAMVTGGVCSAYGLSTWGHLFTDRQLAFLLETVDAIPSLRERVASDARKARHPHPDRYADAFALYATLSASRMTAFHNTLGRWRAGEGKTAPAFGRQAFPMVWDFPEVNPFAGAGGDLEGVFDGLARVIEALPQRAEPGRAEQRDAAREDPLLPRALVSTDPPYYDNIAYADLSDFFYPWIKRGYARYDKTLLGTIATPKDGELVATPYRHGSKENADKFFMEGMTAALRNIASESLESEVATIYYAFRQSEEGDAGYSSKGWEAFLEAVLTAGLAITATWPLRTENATRLIGMGTNALASSILLACRKRAASAPQVSRREFLKELDRVMPRALAEMTADPDASVAPVDLAQAAIGPGMALFSSYSAVIEADGSAMSVHGALAHINKGIDAYFAEAEGELDAESRFCVGWFQQYGFDSGPFGEADVLARAKGSAVDGLRDAGVLDAVKGKVRLLSISEYPAQWDPARDARLGAWEACHSLCRTLKVSESDAGRLLAKMPEMQDAVRPLAYRLFAICERKGWVDEARAYNELIASWPGLVDSSRKAGVKGEQLGLV
jgi:putative DNA methylase